LKLEEPDLHDDPSFIINSVASYIRTGSYSISDMQTREREIRNRAEGKVNERLFGLKKIIYYWMLRQTRKAVKNRENLRFARTKVFGVSRHLFRAIGGNLASLRIVENERDIFFLTLDEIIAFSEGRSLNSDLKSVIADRRRDFIEFKKTCAPPDRFITLGAVGASLAHLSVLAEGDLLRGADTSSDPNILTGTPCSPGLVEGRVRVIEDLKDATGPNRDILVTARTDPGWIPLFPACSGLLIERGSLLSHSAVVARELGLPTIVGVSGGIMARLKTGDRVRMDAGKGEIRILGQT
jgi:pyruvate,water dikinase